MTMILPLFVPLPEGRLFCFWRRKAARQANATDKSAIATAESVTFPPVSLTIMSALSAERTRGRRAMLYLGWIVAAFLAGGIITSLFFTRRRTLRERFVAMGSLVGWEYAQIMAEVKASPQRTVREANGQTLRAWEEGNYFISLLFDKNDVCLGVMDERG